MVHFFLYDYRFERVWKNPEADIEKLSRYRAVLSPDFSMYLEMAPVMQMYNVFRNRWCGAYWASKGIRVIPTVNWGDESTFDFCFDGIEKMLFPSKRMLPCSGFRSFANVFNKVDLPHPLWQFQPTWLPSMIIERIRRNGSWLVTMRCCGV